MEYQLLKREIEHGMLKPNYFFFGQEDFIIDGLIKSIIEKGTEKATKEFNCDVLEGDQVDGATIVNLASSFPMMTERRVVILKSVQRLSTSDKNRLMNYVQKPLESTSLVMTAGKIDRRQKFYATIIKHSQWVESKVLYENQAVKWIKTQLKQRGVDLSDEGVLLMVQQVGTSLWCLNHEIEKLLTYSWGKKKLGLEEVAEVAGFSRKYNVWELTDAVARKDFQHALIVLQHLMGEGISHAGVIMDLGRRVITLMRIRTLLDQGISPDLIPKTLGLRPFFAKQFIEQVGGFSMEALCHAVYILRQADYQMKTGYLDSDTALTLIVHDLIRSNQGTFY